MKKLNLTVAVATLLLFFQIGVFAQKSTDLVISQANYVWENNTWQVTDTIINTYDVNNNHTSGLTQIWDKAKKTFVNTYKLIETYDSHNNELSRLHQKWDSAANSFVNSEQYVCEYNSCNLKKTEAHQTWYYASDTWSYPHTEKYKHFSTYSGQGLLKTDLIRVWKDSINAWVNSSATIYTYSDAKDLLQVLFQNWDTAGKAFITFQKNTYTYDANHNKLTEAIQQITSNYERFVDIEKNQYSYDAKNNLIKHTSQGMDYESYLFVDRQEQTFTYDANNNKLTRLRKDSYKPDKPFENENLAVNTYNAKNNQTSEIWQKWNNKNKAWVDWEKHLYTYDANNNQITALFQEWDTINNVFVNKDLAKYYYKKANPVTKPAANPVSLSWTPEQLARANTAKDISYLAQEEKDAIMYINLARLFPKLFLEIEVENYLGPEKYELYLFGSDYRFSLIEKLNSMTPVKALAFDKDLYESAKCFAKESGDKGITGHERVTCKKDNYAECCSYGMTTGKDIALQWLFDKDVPSLGHRECCLNGKYTQTGISSHSHKKHGSCAVAELI